MLWVVINMLCFMNLVLMVCWNLHMPGFDIYTWYSYFGEFGVNLNKYNPIVWGRYIWMIVWRHHDIMHFPVNYKQSVMVFRLGNDIIMPGGLHIQCVQGRNKTHHSRLVMDIWGECVSVFSKINYKFEFYIFNISASV